MTDVDEQPRHRPEVEMEVLPDGSALLFDPRDDRGHILTALGALIWEMCDGLLTDEEIVAECSALIPSEPQIADVTRAHLREFREMHLLVSTSSEESA
jgi:hypothetical protein